MDKLYSELRDIFQSITPPDVELVHPPKSTSVPTDGSGIRYPNVKNFYNALLYRVLSVTPDPNFHIGWTVELGIVGFSGKDIKNPLFRLKRTPKIRYKQLNTDTYANLQQEYPNDGTVDPYHSVYIALAQYSTVAECLNC